MILDVDRRTVEDLRKILTDAEAILDQLDGLKATEPDLVERRKEAEAEISNIREEWRAELYSAQRRADRLRTEIEVPKTELKKLRNLHFGYAAEKRLAELEAKVEDNKRLEEQRAKLLATPIKATPEQIAQSRELLFGSGLVDACEQHDRKREKLFTELVSIAGKFSVDARAASAQQQDNYPNMNVKDLTDDLEQMTNGLLPKA